MEIDSRAASRLRRKSRFCWVISATDALVQHVILEAVIYRFPQVAKFMLLIKKLAVAAAVFSLAAASAATFAQAYQIASDPLDATFLELREAARREDGLKAFTLASRLTDYSIPSYVDYYRIRPRVRELPEKEIRDYLQRYQGSAIADRLRNDWLLELGKARDWTTFDEQYPQFVLDDDTQLKCYALMSKAEKGVNVADDARALLTSPKLYGEACQVLIMTLAQNNQWTRADLWAQIRLAAEASVTSVARRAAVFTDAPEEMVVKAIDKPALILARGPGNNNAMHQLFIVALGRIAKTAPDQALSALVKGAAQLSAKDQAQAWAQLALAASYRLTPEAADFWRRAEGARLSPEAHQWRARIALRAADWKMVRTMIEAMPASLREDPAWIYWLGRALKVDGKPDTARQKFESIADQIHFYGQLSTEELGNKIVAPPPPTPLSATELAQAAENAGLRRALKFFNMGLRFEGVREWNWELRKMTDRELLAAAEFARQNNVLDRMVNTSDRTRTEMDFTQRFPTPFRNVMQANTQTLGLDMAWVYGLIRQESRFIMNARSHVGASGLMQIMPATAKYVARRIGMNGFSPAQINDIDTNILLGTNYLNMVLDDLDGSQAMASAAYNAGPGRPRAWRSTLPGPVEGAIFAESIPFSETRGYVKNVLSNATYYAAMFENKPQSLKARLGQVAPKDFVASELP